MRLTEHGPLISAEPALAATEFEIDEPVTLTVITGCNGSGKTTTFGSLQSSSSKLKPIMRHTTKELRNTDITYIATSADKFEEMLDDGAFVEAALYGPSYFGTSKEQTRSVAQGGGLAIAEMDLVAAGVFKARLKSIANLQVRLYLLDPFPEHVTTIKERYEFIRERSGRSETTDYEEIVRFKKASATKVDYSNYDIVIPSSVLGIEEVTEVIRADLL